MLAKVVNCLDPAESGGLPTSRTVQQLHAESAIRKPRRTRRGSHRGPRRPCRIPTSAKPASCVQNHPDVLVVPPDPPSWLIKLGQVRQAIHAA